MMIHEWHRRRTRGEAFRPWPVCNRSGHEPPLDPRRERAFRRRPTPGWNRVSSFAPEPPLFVSVFRSPSCSYYTIGSKRRRVPKRGLSRLGGAPQRGLQRWGPRAQSQGFGDGVPPERAAPDVPRRGGRSTEEPDEAEIRHLPAIMPLAQRGKSRGFGGESPRVRRGTVLRL
jgi:hypothetical protein